MKITDVECLVLDKQYPFVRIYTDEGIVGIGECFRRLPEVVRTIVEKVLKPVLLNKDPMDTEVRWREMIQAASASDMGGMVYCAIAGLDIAMWDIKGKALGQPIYELLSGTARGKGRMCARSMRRDLTPLEGAKRAVSLVG